MTLGYDAEKKKERRNPALITFGVIDRARNESQCVKNGLNSNCYILRTTNESIIKQTKKKRLVRRQCV